MSIAILFMRLFLGGLFIYASLHKLGDPVAFSRIVYGYKILPYWAVNFVAIILPGVELVAGAFLLAGFRSRGAAFVISLSLLIFICAIAFNLARGLEFACGCFSLSRSQQGAAIDLLIRDIILLALSVKLVFTDSHILSLDNLLGRNTPSTAIH